MYTTNLKALIVILVVSLAVFVAVKPACLRFMTAEDFVRRRNAWLVLTVIAFLSTSFWMYALLAAPVILWAARKEQNPLALYLILAHVISPYRYYLSAGSVAILDLNQYRILALLVLVPWLWRYLQVGRRHVGVRSGAVDALVLCYIVLQLASLIPHESITATARRAFILFLDVWIIYFAASRSCGSKERIVDVMACFAVSIALMAPLAVFEHLKEWTLYGGVNLQWGFLGSSYLFREGLLRAQVSTGHALGLGYLTATGFGLWLYLRTHFQSTTVRVGGVVWMWMGLLAAVSRAPWLMAIVLYLAFALLNGGVPKLAKALMWFSLAAVALILSPLGDRLIDLLPFVGTVEARNVTYRQQLIEVAWMLAQQHPFFGNPLIIGQADDLVSDEGIVDLLNAYVAVVLHNGFVGLTVFVAFQILPLWMAARTLRGADPDLRSVGACLSACMLATIFYQVTSGSIWVQYVFIGLLLSYASLARRATLERAHKREHRPREGGIARPQWAGRHRFGGKVR